MGIIGRQICNIQMGSIQLSKKVTPNDAKLVLLDAKYLHNIQCKGVKVTSNYAKWVIL